MKIFISGSGQIKKLNNIIHDRLDNIIEKKYAILIGDCYGVDTLVQQYLRDNNYKNVTVFCTGNKLPRNNVGNWKVTNVDATVPYGSREYFETKDVVMTNLCDYGFMVYNNTLGTLNNIKRVASRNKQSVVFIISKNKFITVKPTDNIDLIFP